MDICDHLSLLFTGWAFHWIALEFFANSWAVFQTVTRKRNRSEYSCIREIITCTSWVIVPFKGRSNMKRINTVCFRVWFLQSRVRASRALKSPFLCWKIFRAYGFEGSNGTRFFLGEAAQVDTRTCAGHYLVQREKKHYIKRINTGFFRV